MTNAQPPTEQSILPNAPDTFCTYLARQLIAKRGYTADFVTEAAPLGENCDILLSFSDGYSLVFICLVDREAHPGKAFGLTPEATAEIGQQCLKYTSRVSFNKMPVQIQVTEIGAEDASQRARLWHFRPSSIFSKVQTSGWTVDPQKQRISNNAFWGRWTPPAGFIRKLMASPREDVSALVAPQVAAPAASRLQPGFPYLTTAIIAILCAIFLAEIVFGIGPWTGLLQPSIATLLAFGGIHGALIQQGEWSRLFSGPLLHADIMHLALNCFALFISGRILEGLVGRVWLAAIFVIGALSGALFSYAINPANQVSVGASGAVMALFATLLMLAFHFPRGPERTSLIMNSIYVLIASMAPTTASGGTVDVAAHAGGAIGGLVVGAILLAIWRKDEPHPRLKPVAGAIGVAGLAAFVFAFTPLPQNYRVGLMVTQMVPESIAPKTTEEWRSRAVDLIAKYPRDPRPRYFRAIDLIDGNEKAAGERELHTGLAEFDQWRHVINPEFAMYMRVALAATLAADRQAEAREIAKPTCAWAKERSIRDLLNQHKLCEP